MFGGDNWGGRERKEEGIGGGGLQSAAVFT